MSTLPATLITTRDLVAEYARTVRAALDDLPADTLDDLTDGLEADLLDALADTEAGPVDAAQSLEDVTTQFGPARVYADELRAAAGLAPRAEAQGLRHAEACGRHGGSCARPPRPSSTDCKARRPGVRR